MADLTILYSTEVFGNDIFVHTQIIWKILEFSEFSICPHVDERDWNFMSKRTLLNLLV